MAVLVFQSGNGTRVAVSLLVGIKKIDRFKSSDVGGISMTSQQGKKFLIVLGLGASLFGFQNCSNVGFSDLPAGIVSKTEGDGNSVDGDIGGVPEVIQPIGKPDDELAQIDTEEETIDAIRRHPCVQNLPGRPDEDSRPGADSGDTLRDLLRKKILICHVVGEGRDRKEHNICVSVNALPAQTGANGSALRGYLGFCRNR
jgi:hypothetical protein